MGWLGLKKRPGREHEDGNDPARDELKPLAPLTPVLNLLVPDVAGVTSFGLRQFRDMEAAAEFVQTLPSISGLHAFWGLHETPPVQGSGEATGEAMVLIRSAEDSETVYVVSFVDLDSALSFARFEVKRGMNLNLLLIYWAEIVEVEVDESGVRFVPDVPPLPPYRARSFEATVRAEVADIVVAAPPAPPKEDLELREEPLEAIPSMYARAEAGEPMEPELSWEREPEEEFEQYATEPEAPLQTESEEVPAEAEPVAGEEPEPEPVAVEEPEPEIGAVEEPESAAFEEPEAEPVAIDEPEPEIVAVEEPEAEPVLTQEEIDIEREARAFLKASANGKKPAVEPESPAMEDAAPAEIMKIVVEAPPAAPEPAEEREPVSALAEAEAIAATPEPGIESPRVVGPASTQAWHDSESEDDQTEDRVEEVERILKVKRWDKRSSPFRGFDSPPGRF
jgi:hypothetical protein